MSAPEYVQELVDRGPTPAHDRVGVQIYPGPDGAGPFTVVWPAMGVPARYYRPFAGALLGRGLGVAVVDLRGTGASTPRPTRASRYGYAELTADVGAVLDALGPRIAGRPVLLLGHSLGGQVCLLHAALSADPRVAGLALVGVGLPHWRSYAGPARLGVRAVTQGIAATAAVLGVWPGWGFGGRQALGLVRDWAYTGRTGRFPDLDGRDPEAALRSMTTPVLAVSLDGDGYTPPASMDHLCAKLAAAPVRREHYGTAEAGAPLDHFRWVRAADPLAERIAAFAATVRTR